VLTLFLNCLQTQGNVGKWKKKEGDMVAAGDVLCDIETDKATLDFESLEDGYTYIPMLKTSKLSTCLVLLVMRDQQC
jgi:hypothetical protein